jgi:tetratricopeptide (TPR) repeat protein/O-antigen ligase
MGLRQRYLYKFSHLLILALLFLVPVVYPFKLDGGGEEVGKGVERLGELFARFGLISVFNEQVLPFVNFGHSPLTLKETVAETLILALLICFVLWKFFYSSLRRSRIEHGFIIIFLLYSGISVFYSPTFYYSIRTYFNLAMLALFFLIVSGLPKTPYAVKKFFALILIVSAILGAVSTLQNFGIANSFMRVFPEVRNRIGSFIGHNTGLSAYLMFPIFLLLSLLLAPISKRRKVPLALLLLLLGFVIIAAKSRGVWAVLIFLIPVYLLYFKDLTGIRVPLQPLLLSAVLLGLVFVVQMIPFSFNPFYTPADPLTRRFRHLTPEVLRTETRFRILVCSMPLIGKSPFVGYGIGSFQYVYPKAQGDYFAQYEKTLIWPTYKQTQHAHDEYLQLAVELGIFGLLLALVGVHAYFRRGWATLEQTTTTEYAVLQSAVFIALAAFLLHSFVDFPLHIVPLALNFAFLMAIWSSGKDIWLRHVTEGAPPHGATAAAPVVSLPVQSPARESRARTWGFWSAVIILVLIVSPFSYFTYLHSFGDIQRNRTEGSILSFHKEENATDKVRWLMLGEDAYERGMRAEPLNAQLRYLGGEISYRLGTRAEAEMHRALDANDDTVANIFKVKARYYYERGICRLQSALDEYRVHYTYYYIGMCYAQLSSLFKSQSDLQKAIEYLQLAVRYSPAYAPALYSLAELYAMHNMKHDQILRLRRQIAYYDPDFYKEYYIGKAFKQIYEEQYADAVLTLRTLIEVTPERDELYCFLANALLALGRLDEAEQVLMQLAQINPSAAELNKYLVSLYVKKRDYARALEYVQRVLRTKPGDADLFQAIRIVCLEKLGKRDEAEREKQRMFADKKKLPQFINDFGDVYYNFFGEPDAAIPYYERRIEMQPPPFERVYFLVANYYFEKGDLAKAKQYLDTGLKVYPQYDRLVALEGKMQKKIAPAEGKHSTP